MATSAPREASATAIARPMPRDPPVTTAMRPVSEASSGTGIGDAFDLDQKVRPAQRRLHELDALVADKARHDCLDPRPDRGRVLGFPHVDAQALQRVNRSG